MMKFKRMYEKLRAGGVHVGTEAAKEENKQSTTFHVRHGKLHDKLMTDSLPTDVHD